MNVLTQGKGANKDGSQKQAKKKLKVKRKAATAAGRSVLVDLT